MRKIYYLFLGVLILGSTVITSCSKDDGPKLTKTEMLSGTTVSASKKWKLTAMTSAAPGVPATDVLSQYVDNCDKDDLYVLYSANKKAEHNGGTTKCNTSDTDPLEVGTWSLNSAETELTITLDGDKYVDSGKIKELSDSKLVVEESILGLITLTSTFTAQ